MKKYAIALATMGLVGFTSAATINIAPQYLGKSAGAVTIPSNGSDPVGLSAAQPVAGSSDILVFALRLTFNGAVGEDFRAMTFDVNVPAASFSIVNRNGAAGTGLVPSYAKNPGTFVRPIQGGGGVSPFSLNADSGSGATLQDLKAILVQQTSAADAFEFQNGEPGALAGGPPTTLGFFFVKSTSAADAGKQITVDLTQGVGNPFSFFIGNEEGGSTANQTVNTGIQLGSASISFAGGDIPEPASLGLAAVAGLGLIRRRRA